MQKKPTKQKNKGFSIIELIISIFVLSIAILGCFAAFSIVNILAADSINRLSATYLAQEGMEIIRNIRDTNWLKMDDCASDITCVPGTYNWDSGLLYDACQIQGCQADYKSYSLSTRSGDYLYKNAYGFYGYDSNNAKKTIFQRKIIVLPITDFDEKADHILKVIVQVSWDEKPTALSRGVFASTCQQSNCITLEETLYNWYNYYNLLSNNTTVISAVYTVNLEAGTISNVPFDTSKETFMSQTVYPAGSTLDVSQLQEIVTNNDKITVTAQDGITKKVYNILVNPQQ